MQRYLVHEFDKSTFLVIDQEEQREICVCGNYDDWEDAEARAKKIAFLLNESLRVNPPYDKPSGSSLEAENRPAS